MSRRKTDPAPPLSHVDERGRPAMVDVSGKAATSREATWTGNFSNTATEPGPGRQERD